MEKIALGLGSNKPLFLSKTVVLSPRQILLAAYEQLSVFLQDCVLSSFYRTKPLLYENQDDFINAAVTGFFSGEPEKLLTLTQSLEAHFGRQRQREIKNGPRTLDIDIELFGSRVLQTEVLTIPHPRISERAFVLVPLLEIFPHCADSLNGTPYAEILKKVDTSGIERLPKEFP